MKHQRVTTDFGRLHRKRHCSSSSSSSRIIGTCLHTFSLIFLSSPWFIYVYVDVWRWTSGDINVTSFFTAIPYSDDTVYMRPLKCAMKSDVLQSYVNTCVQSGQHRNKERLLLFTNYTEVTYSVRLPMVNTRDQFLDVCLVVCWRHR
jgi:hypothetical protein